MRGKGKQSFPLAISNALMFLFFYVCVQQEENLLDVLQLVLSIMTEQPDTCIPVFDKVDGLR